MKNKWTLISSIIQILIGSFAIISFIIIIGNVENYTNYVGACILAIGFIVLGIIGIIDYKSDK